MKFIICTGDSHTWGQGPAGLLEHFTDPEVQAGELRPSPFDVPFYVNLVRDEVNRRTGSSAYEEEPRTVIEGEYRTGRVCDAARYVFRFDGHNNYKVASVIDGGSRSPLIDARTDGNGELVITVPEPMHLYRAEYYSGDYAVINSGVGSCTTRRYLEQVYDSYVKLFEPCCIVAEAHSINDWLNHIPLDEVKANLAKILTGCPDVYPVLMTVQPIDGPTAEPFSKIDYEEYIRVSRESAEENGFCLVDGNRAIGHAHFSDNWHPDEEGHAIYAREIMKALEDGGIV